MIPVEWTYHHRVRLAAGRKFRPSPPLAYEELVPAELVELLSHQISGSDALPPPLTEIFDSLNGLDQVREVHVFPGRGDDGLDQIWVVVTEVTPEVIRAITDVVCDIEISYDLIYDMRIVSRKTSVPRDARMSLVKG